ncbi:hypothetical protein DD237_001703 [Peronospora effusa]|uniref:Arrestin C-terminal-like domain-containing protein n=1 Tax=Peronospora effusa TaxID=542832 RepID=A0A3R7Y0Z6_9STRA|nr:hypothetical protein DD237_001703 [Peronospora effusa]
MVKRESVEGVSGRLSITLDKESFAPGDVICGVVNLCMLEVVETKEPLVVDFQGREVVSWDEGGYSPVTYAFDRIFLQHKIQLTPSSLYDVGEREYRFEFQLPMNLPSSFELHDVYSETADRLQIRIKYQTSVWLRMDSDLVAYLNAEQEFTVHAPPKITPPARALEVSASEAVYWLCCIKRGNLQMMVEVPKDMYPSGTVISLQCRVDGSACKATVDSISVELIEDVMLQNLGGQPDRIVSRVLSTQQVAGLSRGHIKDQVVHVRLVENEKDRLVNPDVVTHFVRCTHRLVVRCKPCMAQSIVSELPVRVLHHHTFYSARAGVTSVEKMKPKDESFIQCG